MHENKIVAVGPNAFQQLINFKALALYGNPCMHPNLTDETNPQNLGLFFSEESGNRKWQNEDNVCVSSYSVQRCFNERKIERENFEKKLSDAENKANTCDRKYETVSENCELENENERKKLQNHFGRVARHNFTPDHYCCGVCHDLETEDQKCQSKGRNHSLGQTGTKTHLRASRPRT